MFPLAAASRPVVPAWVEQRLPSRLLHLDAAGSGRPSRAVHRAQLDHLAEEADTGGYVAEAAAQTCLDAGRAALGRLCGLGGGDVAYVENATSGFAALLSAWPLQQRARVGWVRGDYGSNARALARLAHERGWELVELHVDGLGRVVDVPPRLDLVTFPEIASQRGVLQPVAEVQRATDAPVLLDVAQSLGQIGVAPGCAAYVATSRKWLCGPRGAGFIAVDPAWEELLAAPPTLSACNAGVRRFEPSESGVAARVGLAVAAQEWDPAVLPLIPALSAEVRRSLDGVGGWRVVEPVGEPTGITTLRPPAGVQVAETRDRLLRAGLLVSAVPQVRALDLAGPVLRVSTAAWVAAADIEALVAALPRS